jgi:hypothetical protein
LLEDEIKTCGINEFEDDGDQLADDAGPVPRSATDAGNN